MKTLELDTTSEEVHALLRELTSSGEVLIVEHNMPIAKLVPVYPPASTTLKAGCLKGFVMSDDFDEPLEEFKEYTINCPKNVHSIRKETFHDMG